MSIISGTVTHLRAVRSAFGRIVAPDGSPAEAKRKPLKEGFRPDIEGLRAVAVGAVLLYHAGAPFAPAGYVGVDVFFVISGFLITGLLVPTVKATAGGEVVGANQRGSGQPALRRDRADRGGADGALRATA